MKQWRSLQKIWPAPKEAKTEPPKKNSGSQATKSQAHPTNGQDTNDDDEEARFQVSRFSSLHVSSELALQSS